MFLKIRWWLVTTWDDRITRNWEQALSACTSACMKRNGLLLVHSLERERFFSVAFVTIPVLFLCVDSVVFWGEGTYLTVCISYTGTSMYCVSGTSLPSDFQRHSEWREQLRCLLCFHLLWRWREAFYTACWGACKTCRISPLGSPMCGLYSS